jgi:hypothetical protein
VVVAIGKMASAMLGNDVGHSLNWADRLHLSGATKARHQGPIGIRINRRDYDFLIFVASRPRVKVATNIPVLGIL